MGNLGLVVDILKDVRAISGCGAVGANSGRSCCGEHWQDSIVTCFGIIIKVDAGGARETVNFVLEFFEKHWTLGVSPWTGAVCSGVDEGMFLGVEEGILPVDRHKCIVVCFI